MIRRAAGIRSGFLGFPALARRFRRLRLGLLTSCKQGFTPLEGLDEDLRLRLRLRLLRLPLWLLAFLLFLLLLFLLLLLLLLLRLLRLLLLLLRLLLLRLRLSELLLASSETTGTVYLSETRAPKTRTLRAMFGGNHPPHLSSPSSPDMAQTWPRPLPQELRLSPSQACITGKREPPQCHESCCLRNTLHGHFDMLWCK